LEHLHWKSQRVAATTVLVLIGELDRADAASVQAQLRTAAQAEQHVVVDLQELRFIDSSGIKALLEAHRAVTQLRRRFALVSSSPAIQKIFRILGVDQILPVFPTLDAALESVEYGCA